MIPHCSQDSSAHHRHTYRLSVHKTLTFIVSSMDICLIIPLLIVHYSHNTHSLTHPRTHSSYYTAALIPRQSHTLTSSHRKHTYLPYTSSSLNPTHLLAPPCSPAFFTHLSQSQIYKPSRYIPALHLHTTHTVTATPDLIYLTNVTGTVCHLQPVLHIW